MRQRALEKEEFIGNEDGDYDAEFERAERSWSLITWQEYIVGDTYFDICGQQMIIDVMEVGGRTV